MLAAGDLPNEAAPFFCGAWLYGGKKPSGGIGPIAIGDIIRRLVSKCFSFSLAEKAARLLAPFQLGLGVSGRREAFVHTVRAVLDNPNTPQDSRCVLQADLINAFNRVNRAPASKQSGISSLS